MKIDILQKKYALESKLIKALSDKLMFFSAHYLRKNADAKATVKPNGNAAWTGKCNSYVATKKPRYLRTISRNIPNQSIA